MQYLFCPRVRGRNVKLLVLFVALATLSLVLHFRDRLLTTNSHMVRLRHNDELQIERIYAKNEVAGGLEQPAEMVGRDILMSRSVDSEQFDDHNIDLVDTSDRLDSDLIDPSDADRIETVNLDDTGDAVNQDIVEEQGTDSQTGVEIVHVSNGLTTQTGTDQLPQGAVVDRVKTGGGGRVVPSLRSDGSVADSEYAHRQRGTPATATQAPKHDNRGGYSIAFVQHMYAPPK